MKKIGLNELRTMFRDFYVQKGHLAHPSFSLVPDKDKSLLLINSGMAPLKPFFAGFETPPNKRMTTCQKCIRTGDLENVGYTARHGTFFEMLGSFSFGDYFKKESLVWGWEFITEVLEMPIDKLWASIYLDDDEAYDIWVNDVGIAPERIVRMGKEENFWEIGIGPCGPCSEVYFDRGEKYGCDNPDCMPGCECDRYVEFWNHVFTQFNRDEAGNYTPLAHPNIDTGMGLERLACIMQDTDSIFDVDTIRRVLEGVTGISGIAYAQGEKQTDVSIRIITDHIRSVTFMIADGVIPSNEGRGYVLRRLLRRAAVHGKKLGIDRLIMTELANRAIEVSGGEYTELIEKQDYIKKIIQKEEERFAITIDQGLALLNEHIARLKNDASAILAGEQVFRLYDTFGLHPEITKEVLAEHGISIDEAGFAAELRRQQETSRRNIRVSEGEAWAEGDKIISDIEKTLFTGYDQLTGEGKALRIIAAENDTLGVVETASADDRVSIILDQTPFYAQSGGQAADIGEMRGLTDHGETLLRVENVRKVRNIFVHDIYVASGSISAGDTLSCHVDAITRNQTARNHTATHLLHKALTLVLGTHVRQAGSSVEEGQLRFDFTHFEPMTPMQIAEVEAIVNKAINEFLPVAISEENMADAKALGAMALFDEKYGDRVRVVKVGDFSVELCGGTHVKSSGEVGAFKIISESSVGSGTRRIEALTGTNLLVPLDQSAKVLSELSELLKSKPDMLIERVGGIMTEYKEIKQLAHTEKQARLGSDVDDAITSAITIGEGEKAFLLVTKAFKGLPASDLRAFSDDLRTKAKAAVIVLASADESKVTFVAAVSDTLQERGLHAGKLIKEIAAIAGGGGGGKADMAQAGAKDPSKIDAAFAEAERLVRLQSQSGA
jgi:alanyl-tRNA synthetase